MNAVKLFTVILVLIMISACSNLQSGKLFFEPENFGFTPLASGVYVEASADIATRTKLSEDVKKAEQAIRTTYGSVSSKPIVHACVSDACYKKFGGRGSIAKVYYNRILLSPRGLNWHFIAHEWSHAEMSSRLSFSAWLHLPQWFDEGVAVAVSDAPEHSEAHWQFLTEHNILHPMPEELYKFRTLRQWNKAVARYGETKNQERKAKGEPEIRPLYAAAGHELRTWLARVGTTGLLQLIEQLNNGVKFDSAYKTIK